MQFDILAVSVNHHQHNELYINDGTGRFTRAARSRLQAGKRLTMALDVADVDHDGDLDILFGNAPTTYPRSFGFNQFLINGGSGVFSNGNSLMPREDASTRQIRAIDVDGDLDLDIITGNLSSRRLYLNEGSGFTDVSTRFRRPWLSLMQMSAGDVDGDGDIDMLVVDRGERSSLLFNLQRQTDTPRLLISDRRFDLDVYSRHGPPSAMDIATPFLSLARATIPFPPFGTLGLDPTVMVALPPFGIAQPTGVGTFSFTVPDVTAFIGTSVHTQALIVPFPSRGRLSNVTSDRIFP